MTTLDEVIAAVVREWPGITDGETSLRVRLRLYELRRARARNPEVAALHPECLHQIALQEGAVKDAQRRSQA